VLNGLPPGEFPISIFDMVMAGTTVRGSIVGTRLDMIEALSFYAQGKIRSVVKADKLENINQIFDDLQNGRVAGRVVIDFRN
jgi:propanol-preferring alcohol dehydrogenase